MPKAGPTTIENGTTRVHIGSMDAGATVRGETFDGPVVIDAAGIHAPTPKDVFGSTQRKAEVAIPLPSPLTYTDGTRLVIRGKDTQSGNYFGVEISESGESRGVEMSPKEYVELQRDLADPNRENVAEEAIAQADAEIAADREKVVDPEIAEDMGETAVAGEAIDAGEPVDPALFDDDEPKNGNSYDPNVWKPAIDNAEVVDDNDDNSHKLTPVDDVMDANLYADLGDGDDQQDMPTPPPTSHQNKDAKDTTVNDKNDIVDPELYAALGDDDDDPIDAIDPAAEMAKRRELEEKVNAIRENLDGRPEGQALEAAYTEYARCMADIETKSGRIGRRKREKALALAEEKLYLAHKKYAHLLVEHKDKKGLYAGEDAEITRSKSDDFMDEMRGLGTRARRATVEERLTRRENRNLLQRVLVSVGKFLNGGKSKWSWLRSGGAGVGLGALKGAAVVGLGLTPPVTLVAAGLAAGVVRGVGYGSRMNMLDQSLDLEKAELERTQAEPVVGEQERAEWAKLDVKSRNAKAHELIAATFTSHREQAAVNLDTARAKARQNMKHFGIGMAVGAGVSLGGIRLRDFLASHEPVASATGAGGGETLNTSGTPPSAVLDSIARQQSVPFEFPAGADYIRPGEGFLEAFQNAGLTPDQAESLLGNRDLMNELVRQGVAYPDDSIGGYGISRSGRLSTQAMDAIGKAMAAKGYIR